MMTRLRQEVLRLYGQIIRISRTWESVNAANSETERLYIKNEARRLFSLNKHITDEDDIQKCLDEANARVELAIHYRNPYPRPVHVAPAFVPASKRKKVQSRRSEQSKPVYMHSQNK
ncbi:LYR motif-containing protein 1-like [Dysidea avara]|uniref:LYR motif-containing protein 1-like n=1 Tax=Dysidea avara TaxID=196820 RepID=UPI00332ED86E